MARPKNICRIPDCGKFCHGLGYCNKHYQRLVEHGDPLYVKILHREGTAEERFWMQVDMDGPIPSHRPNLGPCWLWTGNCKNRGYGVFGKTTSHAWAYEHFVKAVPDGLTLDHICHNENPECGGGQTCIHRRCCNPSHLEVTTHLENSLRSPTSMISINRAKTHCPRNHPYDAENTYINRKGSRTCRECTREAVRKYRQRKRDEKYVVA